MTAMMLSMVCQRAWYGSHINEREVLVFVVYMQGSSCHLIFLEAVVLRLVTLASPCSKHSSTDYTRYSQVTEYE